MVIQVIHATDGVYVEIIGVIPAHRPRVVHPEPKAAVLKARIAAGYKRAVDAETVFAAKIGAETIIRNAATMVGVARWLSRRRGEPSA